MYANVQGSLKGCVLAYAPHTLNEFPNQTNNEFEWRWRFKLWVDDFEALVLGTNDRTNPDTNNIYINGFLFEANDEGDLKDFLLLTMDGVTDTGLEITGNKADPRILWDWDGAFVRLGV